MGIFDRNLVKYNDSMFETYGMLYGVWTILASSYYPNVLLCHCNFSSLWLCIQYLVYIIQSEGKEEADTVNWYRHNNVPIFGVIGIVSADSLC